MIMIVDNPINRNTEYSFLIMKKNTTAEPGGNLDQFRTHI